LDIYAKCYQGQPLQCQWSKPLVSYFNSTLVKTQLKVLPEVMQREWKACDMENVKYQRGINGSVGLYPYIRDNGYKMLFYSGTSDSLVPTQGTQQWINELGWNVTEEWRPYFIQISPTTKQVAGYVETRGNFTLATVHNGGHMAAKNKKVQTYYAVFNFINGIPL